MTQRREETRLVADTFVDAAIHLCAASATLGVDATVLLHRTNGPAGLIVDTFTEATDDLRRWALTDESWRLNPMMIELRRELAVLGPEAFQPAHYAFVREKGYIGVDRRKHVGYPLLGPGGWFASIGYASPDLPSVSVERQLAMSATELTVWCTARGIATLPEVRPLARRQHEVATLAASGRTNPEIADALGISINTVKLRLKQAFERLGVDNRTELANVLRRLAPLDGIPPGISHRDGVTITRAP